MENLNDIHQWVRSGGDSNHFPILKDIKNHGPKLNSLFKLKSSCIND